MKKQSLILAATFITVAFISCSKEKIEDAQSNNSEELPTATNGKKGNVPPGLNRKLEFWFPFNGNLTEGSGKPIDVEISTVGADFYTEDRFGTPNGAIKFDGSYGLTLNGANLSNNMSVSAWVKYDLADISYKFFYASLSLGQANDKYTGTISTPSTTGVFSNSMDNAWHHLVATYDGSYIKFYVDGSFIGEQYNQSSFNSGPGDATFWVSQNSPNDFWHGSMDDLRFYTRTLSANDVQNLFNQ